MASYLERVMLFDRREASQSTSASNHVRPLHTTLPMALVVAAASPGRREPLCLISRCDARTWSAHSNGERTRQPAHAQ